MNAEFDHALEQLTGQGLAVRELHGSLAGLVLGELVGERLAGAGREGDARVMLVRT